jgi:hypothetical protein
MAITADQRFRMMLTFASHLTIDAVVEKCGVNRITANKFRKVDDWDGFAADVARVAREKASQKLGERRANSIRILEAAIYQMAAWLEHRRKLAVSKKDDDYLLKFNAADFSTIIRLIEFLEGRPDARVAYQDDLTQLEAWVADLPRGSQEAIADDRSGEVGETGGPAELGPGQVGAHEHAPPEDELDEASMADPDSPA